MALTETTSLTPGGEPPSTHRIPRPLPVVHDLHPQYYDGYQGPNHLPARVVYMPISYKPDGNDDGETNHKAVIRLADIWIDPFYDLRLKKYIDTETSRRSIFHNAVPTNLESNHDLTPATIIYVGGGDSDALASTGIAGYIRDAQRESLENNPNARWYARNVVTVSHPMGAPRTQRHIAATSLKLSAEITLTAIRQAVKDGSIKADHIVLPDGNIQLKNVVLMGSSAGGALATELAAIMPGECSQLILEEPAAMGEHENISLNFIKSGPSGAYHDARKHGMNLLQAMRFALHDTRLSWTFPEGAPSSWAELIASFVPHPSRLARRHILRRLYRRYRHESEKHKPPFRAALDASRQVLGHIMDTRTQHIGRFFHIPHVAPSGLNAAALGHDTTAEARAKIKCPVTLVGSTNSRVVNLFRDRAGFTYGKLSQVSAENEPLNVKLLVTRMMKRLFPNASTRLVAMVPGFAHSGLGRNQGVWQQLLTEVQQIPLAA